MKYTKIVYFVSLLLIISCLDTNLKKKYDHVLNDTQKGTEQRKGEKPSSDLMDIRTTIDQEEDINLDLTSTETSPIEFLPLNCSDYEMQFPPLCLSLSPTSVVFRVKLNFEATLFIYEPNQGIYNNYFWNENSIVALTNLTPDTDYFLQIWAEGKLGDKTPIINCHIKTERELPKIVINEVLYDPIGREPAQEFIELYNWGSSSINLNGWKIKDEGGEDTLPEYEIQPNQFVVIVGENYSFNNSPDPVPPLETTIIMHGALGSNGLKNTGERIYLYDNEGNLVSYFPYAKKTSQEGCSWERVSPLLPDTSPQNWAQNLNHSSTPGKINSVYIEFK